ncbi:rod shape-determining protein MreC [Propionivibrio sp.]|uniref:rod shape-determining protein MreC n=1 Tax=Propionivibrio sp. TaxID=2212460 RepID=UPI00262184A3|nr:rod shape-determining protein MreC [Propionivibrio sp.]
MDHQPPPFFKRGPAPLAQLSFYAALSLALIFIDSRFQTLELLRQGMSMFTHPLQQAAHAPVEYLQNAGNYFSGITRYQDENSRLKRAQLAGAGTLLRTRQLEAENERLRKLLDVKGRQKANGRVAQILYAARDPFSRRVIVDKGQQDKIVAGQPVVDDAGVIGQVTRVFPFVAEITLITDKDQAVPVQIVRNGLRSVVFGLGNGQLELRFMPANADVQNGDLLVTSGLDGIFLPGLPVAKVVHIERDTSYSFARIYCVPVAGVENFGDVMVLDPRETISLPVQLTSEAVTSGVKPSLKAGSKKKHLKRE